MMLTLPLAAVVLRLCICAIIVPLADVQHSPRGSSETRVTVDANDICGAFVTFPDF